MDTTRIPPAGDPFTSAPRQDQDYHDHPHGCIDGLVYLGELVEDQETGDEVEVYTAVRCGRCNGVGQMAH